ncbi:spore germination protein (amino acid permease) [Sporobacter termitidis DSM 10068]|uniref:Spore germination protein (Amino acid permease) n=2 Tax=Sporobacter TaxID=44748 RepID=A0A1M5YLX7_9FIRM|nr:spore germination protein (amino acid permease) [Sporobacter termitidis DSM 10068]
MTLGKRFNNQSILDISTSVCGKYIAFIVNIILLLGLIFLAIGNFEMFLAGVGIWFFRSTPTWILAVYLIIPSFYLALKGLKNICRFNFLLYIIIPLILFLIILNLRDFRITSLLPIAEDGFLSIFKAVPSSLFAFVGFETLAFINPYIKNPGEMTRRASLSLMITTLLFTLIMLASIGIFGEALVFKRFNSLLGLARLIRLPVLERIDLYFIAAWIIGMNLVINTYLFLIYDSAQKIFQFKSKLIPMAVIAVLIIIVVSLTDDNILILTLTNISGFVSIFIGFLIPLIFLVIAVIRGKKGGGSV